MEEVSGFDGVAAQVGGGIHRLAAFGLDAQKGDAPGFARQ
jgi:hypothetical protein